MQRRQHESFSNKNSSDLLVIHVFLSFSSEKEVLDIIYKWVALESDLDAQSELISDDRVMITSKRLV